MRTLLPLVLASTLLSCRSAENGAPVHVASPRASQRDLSTDEASVRAMSHALLEAEAQGNVDAFAEATTQNVVLLEKAHVTHRDDLLKGLRARAEHPSPPRVLSYGTDHLSVGASSAVFMGEVVEHSPPDVTGRSADTDG